MNALNYKILVPVCFSELSLLALDTAVLYAQKSKSQVVVHNIIENENGFLESSSSKTKAERNELEKKLGRLVHQKYPHSDIDFVYHVTQGEVPNEINKLADLLNVDMVIMGSHGRPASFMEKILGTNAYRTIKKVPVPVVTVHGFKNVEIPKSIICPIILERKSREKVGLAMHYARLFDAEIKVVAVPMSEREEVQLSKHLHQVMAFISEKGLRCSGSIIQPINHNISETIIQFSGNGSDSLIMIMEDQDENSMRFFANDTEKFVNYSDSPVMSIKPKETRYRSLFQNWS